MRDRHSAAEDHNPIDYTDHIAVARHELVGKDNYGVTITLTDFDKAADRPTVSAIFEAGNQVIVVDALDLNGGEREVDTIVIIGLYIPHDGQCTTVINHCDGCRTFDNADEMFPADDDATT